LPVINTREPGGTAFGKQIRDLLSQKKAPMGAKSEYLLFAADRAQHFEELIIPNLEENKLIITDRCADSSLVYQGFGRGLDLDTITFVNRWAMNHYEPDLIFYVRVDAKTALQRIGMRGETKDAFDNETEEFFKLLINGFDTIFHERPHVITIDGTKDSKQVLQYALETLNQWITDNELL
jgi:dTMP kinase